MICRVVKIIIIDLMLQSMHIKSTKSKKSQNVSALFIGMKSF